MDTYQAIAKQLLAQNKYRQAAQYFDLAEAYQDALAAYKQAHAAGLVQSDAACRFVAALAVSLGDHTFARQLSGQPRALRRVSAWWAALGIALLLAIGAAASRAPQVICTVPVFSAFCIPETFVLPVRVTDRDTHAAIANAVVSLEVGGRAPYRTFTDSEGVGILQIDAKNDRQPGLITVDAAGYRTSSINITITYSPLNVQLQSAP